MGALSINLNGNGKKGQKTLCRSLSSCLRNLHVKAKRKKNKRSSCLYSVKILSVPIWSSAGCRSKAGDPTQSISLQGQQCVCEQTITSHDRAQYTLIYSSLSVALVYLCSALNQNSIIKSLIVFWYFSQTQKIFYEYSDKHLSRNYFTLALKDSCKIPYVWHISLLWLDQYSIIVQLCIKTELSQNKQSITRSAQEAPGHCQQG